MYEKQVDDFFIRVNDLCKDFTERFINISEIEYIELEKEAIEKLMKKIFGTHVLDYVGVKYTKTSTTPYSANYDINFIDRTTHKIINSMNEFVNVITNYNYELCVKRVGPIVIDIDNESVYNKLVDDFFIEINKLCDEYNGKQINEELDIIKDKIDKILVDVFGNNILDYISYVVIKCESIDDIKDVKYSIKFIDKVTQEVINSKDEFICVINNYISYIKAQNDKNEKSGIIDDAPENKYLGTKRDIKFRVWDDEIKQMVPINRIDIGDGSCQPGIFSSKIYDYWNRVELMEYTGLQDKNGNEIYEGDIVRTEMEPLVIDKTLPHPYSESFEGEVRYHSGEFRIYNEKNESCKLFYNSSSLFILGNKYEGEKKEDKKHE